MPFEHGPRLEMTSKTSLTTRHIARGKGKGSNRARSSDAKVTGSQLNHQPPDTAKQTKCSLGSEEVTDLLLPTDSNNTRPNYAVAFSLLANLG